MPQDPPPIVIADWINSLKNVLGDVADKKNNLDHHQAKRLLADINANKATFGSAMNKGVHKKKHKMKKVKKNY